MFTLQISESTFTQVDDYYFPVSTDLGYKLWDSNDLPGISNEFIARGLTLSLYWPKNKDYRVAGNYLSEDMRFISIVLKRWQGSGWKSTADIDNAINKVVFSIMILNSYMDFNDYENPVKSYIDDRITSNLEPGHVKYVKNVCKT